MSSRALCQPGYFLNNTNVSQLHSSCVPCTPCAAGNGSQTLCHNTTDSVCAPCTPGYYSEFSASHNNWVCKACINCTALNRTTISDCTPSQDSTCGKCFKDYFLTVNSNGYTECAVCSYCPPGREVARWYDCTHLPVNQQCAPGSSACMHHYRPHPMLPPATIQLNRAHWGYVYSAVLSFLEVQMHSTIKFCSPLCTRYGILGVFIDAHA